MLEEVITDANERMGKTLDSLQQAFSRIRTGRANPNLLDGVSVNYYDVDTPLSQVASISVGRCKNAGGFAMGENHHPGH